MLDRRVGTRLQVHDAADVGTGDQMRLRGLQGLELEGTQVGLQWRLTASAYDYLHDVRRRQAAANATQGSLTRLDGTGWQTLDAIVSLGDVRASMGHQLTIGAHHDRYVLQSNVLNVTDWQQASGSSQASAFAGRTRTTALFTQDLWRFRPDWQASFGLRAERWDADRGSVSGATATQSFAARRDSYLSPKLGLSWQRPEGWQLSLATGLAYRLPTVAELFQGTLPNAQNTVTYNNPALRPEQVGAANLDATRRFDTAAIPGSLRATAFIELTRNALLRLPVPPTDPYYTSATGATTSYWVNVDTLRSEGGELAWEIEDAGVRALSIQGSATYVRSRILRNPMRPAIEGSTQNRVPRWRITLVANYQPTPDWSFTLASRYSGLQRNGYPNADIRPNTYLGFASYIVFDARVTWRPRPSLMLAAGIDNLTNRLYYQYHPYPGRTLLVELRWDQK